MKYFYMSHLTTIIGLILAYSWAGLNGLLIAALLMVMEISLSFDNAVVNATVLKTMSEKWQQRFLTWGILVAVFGMRLLFPILVVAFATGLGMGEVATLALEQPEEYSRHVLESNVQISAFGGMFLLMVFLHFIMDESKDVHWIGFIESKLAAAGKLESAEIIIATTLLLVLTHLLPESAKLAALTSGLIGVVTYVAIKSLMSLFISDGQQADQVVASSGFMGFMYLQILDASFSLDGVVGAFAISKDVVIIMLGLGIGAMFVRSLTVYLVRKGTLDEFVYLEHGAHYGIGVLALIMLLGTMMHVPEIITGLIGVAFIGLSLWSSILHKRKLAA
jgi:uncharacterized protein